jgi:hypothetical protein
MPVIGLFFVEWGGAFSLWNCIHPPDDTWSISGMILMGELKDLERNLSHFPFFSSQISHELPW